MKHIIWLAVDSNGDEKLTSNPGGFQRFLSEQSYDRWIENNINLDEIEKFGCVLPHWNYLPKGTIKKIIGKELTWEDDPVLIEEFKTDYCD